MPRINNFDILRLVLAWLVVVVHCCSLSMQPELQWIPRVFSAEAAFEGFFAISGCLIVASYHRSRSWREYFVRRAERLLPGYYTAMLLALGIGVVMTSLPLNEFMSSPETWKFLGANLVLLNGLQSNLPGVFVHNPAMANVNGALWTMKVEVGFYLIVPILFWLMKKIGRPWTLLLSFGASVGYRVTLGHLGDLRTLHGNALERQLPGELAYFIVGAAVYFYYPLFAKRAGWMWTCAIGSYAVALATGVFAFRAVGLALLVMCVAFLLPPFKGLTRHGDFSYGAYVLHFPIVQTAVALGFFTRSPYLSIVAIACVVAPLSVVSWHWVERPFLRRERVRAIEQPLPSPGLKESVPAY